MKEERLLMAFFLVLILLAITLLYYLPVSAQEAIMRPLTPIQKTMWFATESDLVNWAVEHNVLIALRVGEDGRLDPDNWILYLEE